MRFTFQRLSVPALMALFLCLAWLAYRPGLAGGFLFDDFVNLPALGATGRVDDAAAFWRYLTSGTADPTGRPLALLSFLLDARDWPADAEPFLRTNILLHLLNGALLFALLRALGRRLDGPSNASDAAAVLGAALWLLHPLFVSTTLYIVQREAMLPATFTLCGLLAWVHGTGLLPTSRRAGIAWMLFAIGVCTPLAVAAKANGILLPILAWVVDAILLRRTTPAASLPLHRGLARLLLVLPSLALFAYLALHLRGLDDSIAGRPWTIGERLLTQPRVLLDYLTALVVPRVLTTGLYNDAYVHSTGLLQPASTLPSLLIVAAMLLAGLALRRRAPAESAALLFFFAAHLLESSVIALELYFEHRNYLPALLLFWPLARAIARWRARPWLRTLVAVSLVVLLTVITWQRASLWAQQERMAMLWAAQNPDSSRAQATAAIFESRAGRPDLAYARLDARARLRPRDLQLVLNRASAACGAGGLSRAETEAVARALRTAVDGDQLVHRWLNTALDKVRARSCPGLGLATVEQWIAAARANPKLQSMPGRQQDLYSLEGRVALAHGQPQRALRHFNDALEAWPTPQAALHQAGLLASGGCHAQALAHLDRYDRLDPIEQRTTSWSMRRLNALVLQRQRFWETEFAALRRTIADDLARDGSRECAK